MINLKTKSNPLVSIIVPCYNGEDTITETMKSIFDQDYAPIEIIIVNDGSTDHSLTVINTYCERKPNVAVISQDNQGLSSARNTGLANAKGEYVISVDADDILKSGIIVELLNPHLENSNLVLSYCNTELFERESGIIDYEEFSLKRFLLRNCIPAFAMAKRIDLINVGGFDVNLRSHEDWECWIRMIIKYGPLVHKSDKALYLYRKRAAQNSLIDLYNADDVVDHTYLYIFNKHYEFYRKNELAINTLFYAVIGIEEFHEKRKNKWYRRLFNS